MTDLSLPRPANLQSETWRAIEASRQRLERALAANDLPQSIGCAKELVESVAKVVIVEQGEAVEGNAKFPNVINKAHIALLRQPGPGLSGNETLRQLAGATKNIATTLGELRNQLGAGHGRAYEPQVAAEDVTVAVDGALLWVRWALRRLDQLLHGALTPLINDLAHSAFSSGTFSSRVAAANVPNLDVPDQQRLGVAVGQRAMRDTFLIMGEGVESCAREGLDRWPAGYRRGVLQGLFVDRDGYVTVNDWSAQWAPLVIAPVPDAATALDALADQVSSAPITPALAHDWGRLRTYHQLLAQAARTLPADARGAWLKLAAAFDPGPF